jgi:hypothetical protein
MEVISIVKSGQLCRLPAKTFLGGRFLCLLLFTDSSQPLGVRLDPLIVHLQRLFDPPLMFVVPLTT